MLVKFRVQMAPRSSALQYPSAPPLMKYASKEGEVSREQACTKKEMATSLHRGLHPSYRTLDAIEE